jgi:hypothetical protein
MSNYHANPPARENERALTGHQTSANRRLSPDEDHSYLYLTGMQRLIVPMTAGVEDRQGCSIDIKTQTELFILASSTICSETTMQKMHSLILSGCIFFMVSL